MDLYPRNGAGHVHHHRPGSDISGPLSNFPAKLQYEMSSAQMTQLHITNLQNSPRNSRSSFTMPPNDLTRSIKSLQSFKELFVDRKRISMGHIIMEGERGGREREREREREGRKEGERDHKVWS